MLLDPFHTYAAFINLDHRKDRLYHMQDELEKIGLEAERFPALKTSDHDWDRFKTSTMMARTPGAVGCHYSQVAVMEKALKLGKHALVMEDDLVFCSDFADRIKIIETFLSQRIWDVFWFGGTFHVNPAIHHKKQLGRDAVCTEEPRILRTYGAFSTFAYLVNYDSIPLVLSKLDNIVHTSIGIDWAFIQLEPSLNTYAFVPGCVKQIDNVSDIGSGMTIFSGFAKLNGTPEKSTYWWQDKMTDFNPENFDWAEAKKSNLYE